MAKVHGYISIKAEAVFSAAVLYLEDRKSRMAAARDEWVKKKMAGRWFPPKTEEAAVKLAYIQYTTVPFWEWQGSIWADRVEELQNAAFIAMAAASGPQGAHESEYMLLSIEMADSLHQFFKVRP